MIPIEQYLNDMLTGILKIAYADLVTRRNSFNSGFSIDFLMLLSRPFLSVPQTNSKYSTQCEYHIMNVQKISKEIFWI